jgi:glycosyltransferase involved in cell wall biosynthesis
MKIAIMSHFASTAAPTGAERVIDLLARGLNNRGHRVTVSTPGRWMLASGLLDAGVEVRSIPVRACWLVQWANQPFWRQAFRFTRYVFPDRGVPALRRFVRDFEPDVVHVNCLPHLRGAAIAHSCGRPVVWHIHEILPPGPRRRFFARRLRRDATRIVAVSEAVAWWLRDEGLGDLVEVVHNAIEPPAQLPKRAAAREMFGLPTKACVIGLFGQLVEHKGALHFVHAAHRAASSNSDLHFLIAGHGPRQFFRRLHREIVNGPARDRIHLVPPQKEIWSLLAAVDVVAITTLWPDPLPRVVMEAMAVGLPVAGYGGGGVPEMVVHGENGILSEPEDVDGLAAAFERLAGDAELRRRMGEAGSLRARDLFTVQGHVDRMEAVLARVI